MTAVGDPEPDSGKGRLGKPRRRVVDVLVVGCQIFPVNDLVIPALVEIPDAGFLPVAETEVESSLRGEVRHPRGLDQQHPGAVGRQLLLDVTDQAGAAPFPLVIGVDGEHVEVPGAVGHPLRCVVGDGRRCRSGGVDDPAVTVRGSGQKPVEGRPDLGQLVRREKTRRLRHVDDRSAVLRSRRAESRGCGWSHVQVLRSKA